MNNYKIEGKPFVISPVKFLPHLFRNKASCILILGLLLPVLRYSVLLRSYAAEASPKLIRDCVLRIPSIILPTS